MRKIIGILFGLASAVSVFGQITDDSTTLVYGPHTTKYIYEEQVLNNQIEYVTVDSTLSFFDRQSIVDRNERKFQNLGNFGTAVFPVFYTPQQLIGRTSGFNAFAPYSRGQGAIKYYDTKSPFIDLFAYLGGGNKNIVRVDFSRNVREGWNIGFDLHKITTDKIIANDGEGDRQTENTAFDIYTHYKHPKAPYQAMIFFHKLSHKVVEIGGVRYGNDSTLSELFQLNNALLRLQGAQNKRNESQWHLYHDYQLTDQFQIYHKMDLYTEENSYQDFKDNAQELDPEEYDTYRDAYNGVFQIDADSTYERSTFVANTQEAGIKGDLSSFFYRAYIKLRTVDYNLLFLDPVQKTTEEYLGGYIRFNWKEKFNVIGQGELLQGGEYKFQGKLASDLLNVSYLSSKYNVPFIYGSYFGNHYEWSNSFTPVFVNQIKGSANLKYKFLSLRPEINITNYTDYVYFDTDKQPAQASGGVTVSTIGGRINSDFVNEKGEGFVLQNEVLATNVSGGAANVIRIPELFYNGRYYWRGLLFGDKIPVEVGFDTHARSSYFVNNYDPVTQQFYLQDEFEISSYFKADLFFNMRLDKFYVGIKWAHFDQQADSGYFVTPYYPGQPKMIDLLIRWTFFD